MSASADNTEGPSGHKPGGGSFSLGVSVSTMANDEEELDDTMKTIFDWCKEGNTKQVSKLLQKKNEVDTKDKEVIKKFVSGVK